jgi:very-short-patch-repair endonuclease
LSGSILESLTRVLLWRHHLPVAVSQHPFCHPQRGLIGYVDFAWPQLKAILECDGYEFHSSRGPFQKDRRRWSAIGSSGWHLAVVTWFDVTCDPGYVVALALDLLAIERGSCTQP